MFKDCDDGEHGEELRAPKRLASPLQPTAEERDEHNASGHAVYRNWCRPCVLGRCREWPHGGGSSSSTGENRIPVLSFDYCYLCTRCNSSEDERIAEERGSSPLLVLWDSHTKAPYVYLLPSKGVDFLTVEHAVENISQSIYEYLLNISAFKSSNFTPTASRRSITTNKRFPLS